MLGHLLPVMTALEISKQWFDANGGVITMPGPQEPIIGSHCVTLFGFDRLRLAFVFQNSWGRQWGNRGFGLLPLDYFDKYLVSAWAMCDVRLPRDVFRGDAISEIPWGRLDCLGNSLHGGDVIHGREVYDGSTDERVAWAFAVHRDGFLDVEELFVRPQFRRQGYGSQLADALLQLADELKRPLRVWVPFPDWTVSNLPAVERMVKKLGLTLFHANVRWAAAMALNPSELPSPANQGVRTE